MKNSKRLVTFLLIGIAISAFIFSPFILDFTLVPRFIVLSILAFLFLALLHKTSLKLKAEVDIPLFFFVLYAGFCALSSLWCNTLSEAIFESAKVVLSVFVLCAGYFCLKEQKEFFMIGFLKISMLATYLGFFIAIYQYSKTNNLDKDSLYQITSMNGHKNLYASFIFINLFFLVRGFYFEKGLLKLHSIICILISLGMTYLLKSKAVWMGASITIFVFVILQIIKQIKFSIPFKLFFSINLIVANLFFFLVLPWVIQEQVGNYRNSGIGVRAQRLDPERLILWEKTYEAFKKKPIIDAGQGNWQIDHANCDIIGLFRGEDLNYTFQRPHNDFLWILSETGIVGFNLFFISISLIMLWLLKTIRNHYQKGEAIFEMSLCFSFITGYFWISFFDFPKERIEHLIWISSLLSLAYYFIKKHNSIKPILTLKRNIISLSCLPLFIFITYVGILRYKGEFFARKMFDAKALKKDDVAVRAGYKAFSFAYTIDPTSIPIHWYTANSLARLGNSEAAHKDFLTALIYNPYNRNVLNDLGSSYALNGNMELAKKYYKESARISPRFDDPKLNLAAIYIQQNNYLSADSCLKTLVHNSERRKEYETMVNAFIGKEPSSKN